MKKIYYFNPTAEMAIVNGLHSYQPPKLLQIFEQEMSYLLLFAGDSDDLLLVNTLPDPNYLQKIKVLKPNLPKCVTLLQLSHLNLSEFEFTPWGWSPDTNYLLKSIVNLMPAEHRPYYQEYNHQAIKKFYSRELALNVLNTLLQERPNSFIANKNILPQICTNITTVEKLLKQWSMIVLKAPLSSSGRGLQMLRKPQLNASNKSWISGVLTKQSLVMAEQLHKKIADLSFHFYKKANEKPEFLGTVFFNTNSNGQFKGCYLYDHPDAAIMHFIQTCLKEQISNHLAIALMEYYANYDGYLGVDAMIIEQDNTWKLHPCVEINARMTMGLLTIKLRELALSSYHYWSMSYDPNTTNLQQAPSLALTPINKNTKFTALLYEKQ